MENTMKISKKNLRKLVITIIYHEMSKVLTLHFRCMTKPSQLWLFMFPFITTLSVSCKCEKKNPFKEKQ